MNITFEELMELARKATMYDAIINYIRVNPYASCKDIIAMAGEDIPSENTVFMRGDDFND